MKPTRVVEGRPESSHECELCGEDDYWPDVFWADPFWLHSECLKEAVVAAMAERMRRRLDEVKGDPEATERLQKEIMRGEFP